MGFEQQVKEDFQRTLKDIKRTVLNRDRSEQEKEYITNKTNVLRHLRSRTWLEMCRSPLSMAHLHVHVGVFCQRALKFS